MPGRIALRAGKNVVVDGFDARGAVNRACVAHRMRGERSLRVGAHVGAVVLQHTLGQGDSVACEDAAAAHLGRLGRDMVVRREHADLLGLEDLQICQACDEGGVKCTEESGENGEAARKCDASKHA